MKVVNFTIRLLLTVLLVAWAVLPYLDASANENILGEIHKLGIVPMVAIIGAFFIMVACYCRTLQTCLALIKPENRKAAPASVWYMFALPFNFVEDFFIVINLANSIETEKNRNSRLSGVSDFGMTSGIGWCIAQLLSFIPNVIGQIAGLAGMVLVVIHWRQIARINKQLTEKTLTF